MSTARNRNVSIMGMGSVGTAIAYACLIRGAARALALYDIYATKVRAEVLDLNHGSQFVPHCTITGSDDIAVTADSAVVVITAGAKQKPGQSRLDLAAANVAMARSLVPQLIEHSPNAIVVLVTNPVDVVTLAAVQSVDLPRGRVFGSGTLLDSSRFRYLIAERADLAVGNVHGFVVGEHGDSEIALWSNVSIGGVDHGARGGHRASGSAVGDRTARPAEFGNDPQGHLERTERRIAYPLVSRDLVEVAASSISLTKTIFQNPSRSWRMRATAGSDGAQFITYRMAPGKGDAQIA